MIKYENRPKLFFGWWTVWVTGAVSGLGLGFYYYGISALLKPMAFELGLNRAVTSGAMGTGIMVGSLMAPFTGWLADNYGSRFVTTTGLIITVIGLALLNTIQSGWSLYIVWGVILGIGVNFGFTVAIDKALTDWFVKKIGLALGIKFALIGLIGALTLPAISWLISQFGWRHTCLIWAAVMFCGLPFILTFVKKRPETYGLLPDGDSAPPPSYGTSKPSPGTDDLSDANDSNGYTLQNALKTRFFWLITVCMLVQLFVMGSFNTHCIPFLTEMNINPLIAGSMMGSMVFFSIPARLIVGVLADRLPEKQLTLLFGLPFLLQAVGIGAFLIKQTYVMIYNLLILYGIAHGLPTPLLIVFLSRYFGRNAFGAIFGAVFSLISPIALFGPILTGWLFDKTGSYGIALQLFVLTSCFALILLFFLKPPNHRRQK